MTKKLLFLIFIVTNFHFSFAQKQDTTYFKDYTLTKEVKAKKGKYKKISTENGTERNVEIYDLRLNLLLKTEHYLNNNPSGVWKWFDGNGEIKTSRNFTELTYSTKIDTSLFNNAIENGNYQKAKYGNGVEDMFKYLAKTMKYPYEAKDFGISGVVYLSFEIDKLGAVKNITIIKGVHPVLDYESYRVIKKMKNWNPAKKNGVNIESTYSLPLKFTLK